MSAPIVAVVGSTATGKSELGIALAIRLGGEIINTDSMQLYRGMDIGTAKLQVGQMQGIPHHLFDIWDVTQTASVADYQVLARGCISEIEARGNIPILVGGSGLYVTAVIDEVAFPATDPAVRTQLEGELERLGSGELHRRLSEVDPAAADRILPSNGRKIVRALEVVTVTGRPFVAALAPVPAYPNVVMIGVRVEREKLRRRIADRVDRMWDAGLVDEVRKLESEGLRGGVTASRALGYAQVLAMLDGRLDEIQAKESTVHSTRRFARRQASWWRRDERINWLEADVPDVGLMSERALGLVMS